MLRQLIAGDESLDCPAEDSFLVKFLRARKHRAEEAFQIIRNYFLLRQCPSGVLADLSPYTVPYREIIIENHLILVSKLRDPEGRAAAMLKLGAWNTGICSLTDLIRATLVLAEWTLEDKETQIRGVVCVVDLKGLQLSHMIHLTPFLLKKVAHIVQDCFPMRLKAVYVINNPHLCELLYGMLKPFLKSKLAQRFHFMGYDLRKLHGILPSDFIPAEFGGTHEDFDYQSQERSVKSMEDYFQRVSRWGYRKE